MVEQNQNIELTSGQRVTAEAKIFIEETKLPEKAVDKYLSFQGVRIPRWRRFLHQDRIGSSTRVIFSNLFKIPSDDEEQLGKFKEIHGNETERYIDVKKKVEDDFSTFRNRILTEAVCWSDRDRFWKSLDIVKEIPAMSGIQRRRLLELVGYTAEESNGILLRTAVSGFVYPAFLVAEEHVPSILGVTGGLAAPLLNNNLTDINTLTIAVGSAFAYYGTQVLKIEQTKSLLRDKRIKLIPSPTAAIGYHLFEKIFADKPSVIDWAARVGYVINPLELAKELWWGTLLVNPSIFLAGNIAAIGMNFLEMGTIEVTRFLQILESKRHNFSNSEKQNVINSNEIDT